MATGAVLSVENIKIQNLVRSNDLGTRTGPARQIVASGQTQDTGK
jgi:hypothetical protein